MAEEKQFIVTGMHRSATSLVAKGLQQAGVEMGQDLLEPNDGNPEGYFEDREFVYLNEAILRLSGGEWHTLPPEADVHRVGAGLSPAIGELLGRRHGQALWGAKDPRFCATLPLYGPFLAADTHIVAVFRRPQFAAQSLHARDGMPLERAGALGLEYNRRLLKTLAYFTGVMS